MNKEKAGVKGKRGRRGKKACHFPFALCGSLCVIGWLSFRWHQSQSSRLNPNYEIESRDEDAANVKI